MDHVLYLDRKAWDRWQLFVQHPVFKVVVLVWEQRRGVDEARRTAITFAAICGQDVHAIVSRHGCRQASLCLLLLALFAPHPARLIRVRTRAQPHQLVIVAIVSLSLSLSIYIYMYTYRPSSRLEHRRQ